MANPKWPEPTHWKVTLTPACSNCAELEAEIKSLCQQLAEMHRLWQESCSDAFEKAKQLAAAVSHGESTIAAQDFRRIALEEKLTSANTIICAMTEGLQTISRQPEDHWSKFVAVKILGDAFSFPPTCLHKEEVERLKEDNIRLRRAIDEECGYHRINDELIDTKAKLASLQEATICGMREVLLRLHGQVCTIGLNVLYSTNPIFDEVLATLSSSPTCPHKERAEGITKAETAEQARLINERDDLRAQRDKWKRRWEEQLTLLDRREGPLVYSSVLQRAEKAEAELVSLQEADIKNHEIMADYVEQLAQVREALERAYKHWGALNKRRFFLINRKVNKEASKEDLSELEGLQEVASVFIDERLALQGKALSSHKSKWGVKKEG